MKFTVFIFNHDLGRPPGRHFETIYPALPPIFTKYFSIIYDPGSE